MCYSLCDIPLFLLSLIHHLPLHGVLYIHICETKSSTGQSGVYRVRLVKPLIVFIKQYKKVQSTYIAAASDIRFLLASFLFSLFFAEGVSTVLPPVLFPVEWNQAIC